MEYENLDTVDLFNDDEEYKPTFQQLVDSLSAFVSDARTYNPDDDFDDEAIPNYAGMYAIHVLDSKEEISRSFRDKEERVQLVGLLAQAALIQHFPEVKAFALQTIQNNIDCLAGDLADDSINSKFEIFDALHSLALESDYSDSKKVLEIVDQNRTKLFDGFISEYRGYGDTERYYDFIEFQIAKGSDEQTLSIYNALAEFLYSDESDENNRAFIAARLFHSPDSRAQKIGAHYVGELIRSAQLQESLLDAWKIGWPQTEADLKDSHISLHEGTMRNVAMILKMEKARPGAVAILNREFGICNFGRYKESLLLKQIDRMEDTSRPYALIATAMFDYNGASASEAYVIADLDKDYQDEVNVRFVEFMEPDELLAIFDQMDAKYGVEQKIKMIMVIAHGNALRMAVGKDPRRDAITREWMLRVGLHGYRNRFSDDAVMVLASCETGLLYEKDETIDDVKEEARFVGESFGQILGLPTIAPEKESRLTEIHPIKHGDSFDYDVVYSYREEYVDEDGRKVGRTVDFKGRILDM